MSKKIYISGPMSGYENLNYASFMAAEKILQDNGFEVVNPARINPPTPEGVDKQIYWQQCMKNDVVALMDCDFITLLPNWENSKGAGIEFKLASQLGIELKDLGEFKADQNKNDACFLTPRKAGETVVSFAKTAFKLSAKKDALTVGTFNFKAVKSIDCKDCYFFNIPNHKELFCEKPVFCSPTDRPDKTSIAWELQP